MNAVAEQEKDVQEAETSTAEEPEILNLDLEEKEEVSEQETPEPEAEESAEEESSTDEEPEPESEKQEEESVQEEVKEVKPTPKVPLPRLRKEIQKRKELEQKLHDLESKAAAQSAPEPAEDSVKKVPKMPTMADSGYDEEKHQEAMTRYFDELTDYKLSAREEQRKREAQAQEQQNAMKEAENRMQSFFENNEEYQEVLQELVDAEEVVQYSPAVARAVQFSDFGPQLDLYLLKNRNTVLPELNAMSPERQLMELGRIQASFESTPAKKKEVQPMTKAPAPIKTASGGARSTSEDLALQKIYGKGFVIK